MSYRNYRELTQKEIDRLATLYPTTTNRELSKLFGLSIDAIQDRFAYPLGWKKTGYKQGSRGGKSLDEKQVKWIIRHYKHTRNADILEKFNIGESTLHRIARKYGLVKSRHFTKKHASANNENAMATCLRYNLYDEFAENTRKQWEQWRATGNMPGFKKGESNRTRMSKKRYEAMLAKASETRRETIRKERMRINWGLPQKTKLKVIHTPLSRARNIHRHRLRKAGYIIERATYIAYYTENTARNEKLENNSSKYGIKIEQS